jgi:hypothetical protein
MVIGTDSAMEKTEQQIPDVVMPTIQSTMARDSINSNLPPTIDALPKRNRHLYDAISTGVNGLSYVLHEYVIKNRQDTLTDVKYLILDYGDMRKAGQAEIDRYIDEIQNQYSDKELNHIRQVLINQCDSNINSIKEVVKSR